MSRTSPSPRSRSAAPDPAKRSPDTLASLRADLARLSADHEACCTRTAGLQIALENARKAQGEAEGALKWHEERAEALVRDLAREQADRRAVEKREAALKATVSVLTAQLADTEMQLAGRDEIDDVVESSDRIRKAVQHFVGGTTIPAVR